jgi:hypothetical protein
MKKLILSIVALSAATFVHVSNNLEFILGLTDRVINNKYELAWVFDLGSKNYGIGSLDAGVSDLSMILELVLIIYGIYALCSYLIIIIGKDRKTVK